MLCGAVHGDLRALSRAVERAEAKAGQFNAIFVVGQLLPNPDAPANAWDAFRAAQSGERLIRPPVYAIDLLPNGASIAPAPTGAPTCVPIANGLHWLRGGGCKWIASLHIAWLSGTHDDVTWNDGVNAPKWASRRAGEVWPGDFESLRHDLCLPEYSHTCPEAASSSSSANASGATGASGRSCPDILLTSEWPDGIAVSDPSPPTVANIPSGTLSPREANLLCSPRYHVAPGPVFHNRAPFVSAAGHATRFVSLAPVGSGNKFLHALKLVPLAEAQPPAPAMLYPNPFYQAQPNSRKRKRGQDDVERPDAAQHHLEKGGQQDDTKVFLGNIPFKAKQGDIANALDAALGVHANAVIIGKKDDGKAAGYAFVYMPPKHAELAVQQGSMNMQGREIRIDYPKARNKGTTSQPSIPQHAVEGCWFCLDNDKDTHLVASVGQETFIAADKAPLTDKHALILPIAHAPSVASLPESTLSEVWAYVYAMARCFREKLGEQMVAFERHLKLKHKGGNHCHVNCLPCPDERAAWIESILNEEARSRSIQLTDLGYLGASSGFDSAKAFQSALQEHIGRGEYFVAILPDGKCLAHIVGQNEKHPVGFGREALSKVLGKESRAHWRSLVDGEDASTEKEESAAEQLRRLFAPHDPLMEHEGE